MQECQNREFGHTARRNTSARLRMKTFNNMHLVKGMEFTDKYNIPILKPYRGSVSFDISPYARRVLWEYGMRRMEEELVPATIIVYGRAVEVPELHTPLMFIPDHITKHFRP